MSVAHSGGSPKGTVTVVLEETQISSRDEHFEDFVHDDERVRQEFQELTDFLQHIAEVPGNNPGSSGLGIAQLGCSSQMTRWRIQMSGQVRLERVNAFRERLQKQPEAVDVRIEEVTGGRITLRLITGASTTQEQIETRISMLRDSVASDISVEPLVPASGG